MAAGPLDVLSLLTGLLVAATVAFAASRWRRARALPEGSGGPAGIGRNLLDALHDAVYTLSPDRRILTWNAAAERIYGIPARDAVGRVAGDLLRSRFASGESYEQVVAELARVGQVRRDLLQARSDGGVVEVESHGVAVRDAVGALTAYVVVNRDVTARRRAEEALRTSEAKFRAGFLGAGIPIALLDAEGRLLEHNPSFAALVGYSDAELRGRPISELLHPDDVERARADLRSAVEEGRDLVEGERRYVRKDGRVVQTMLRSSIVRDASGQFLHSVGIVEDVTQKKVVEAQLALADRTASLGTLAAGVAHEINNPLAYMLSNLDYVTAELARARTAPPDVLRALGETRDGVLRVREIVRDLKTFSRPDDSADLVVDVREALRSSLHLTENELRHRARVAVRMGDVPLVLAHPHRLSQVFVNLLLNAAQAITQGEPARHLIEVTTATAEDGRARITVRDTGTGIAPEHLSRIFDPFFTTKPVGVGTGLGLSICHGLVARMGGEIRVESRVGHGATFHVLLPAAPADSCARPSAPSVPAVPEPGPPVAPDDGAHAARLRLLVVDDEPLVGNAIERALGPEHEVTAVASARAALESLETDRFDAILCDLMMPDMTGMELHARLAASRPALATRMIFLTGGAFTPRARAFLESVPNPRVEKPFEREALRSLVRQVAQR